MNSKTNRFHSQLLALLLVAGGVAMPMTGCGTHDDERTASDNRAQEGAAPFAATQAMPDAGDLDPDEAQAYEESTRASAEAAEGEADDAITIEIGQTGLPVLRPLDFAELAVNLKSAPRYFNIVNRGNVPANGFKLAATPTDKKVSPALTVSKCPKLAAAASCTVAVTAAPKIFGAAGSTIVLTYKIGKIAYRHVLDVQVIGVPRPVLTLSSSPIDLGGALVGARTKPVTVTVINAGPTTVSALKITANKDLLLVNTCGKTLAIGSCYFQLSTAPKQAGRLNSLVTMKYSDGKKSVTLKTPTVVLGMVPASLAFRIDFNDPTRRDTASEPISTSITNVGDLPATDIRVPDVQGFNVESSSCRGLASLAPKATCTEVYLVQSTSTKGRKSAAVLADYGNGVGRNIGQKIGDLFTEIHDCDGSFNRQLDEGVVHDYVPVAGSCHRLAEPLVNCTATCQPFGGESSIVQQNVPSCQASIEALTRGRFPDSSRSSAVIFGILAWLAGINDMPYQGMGCAFNQGNVPTGLGTGAGLAYDYQSSKVLSGFARVCQCQR